MATSIHFTDKELGCCECGINRSSSRLVQALEALWTLIGEKIKVHSAYRCTAHTTAHCGTASGRHLSGDAADISVRDMTARELYSYAVQVKALREFGLNDHTGWLHVAVRPEETRWCYDRNGKPIQWSDVAPLPDDISDIALEDAIPVKDPGVKA